MTGFLCALGSVCLQSRPGSPYGSCLVLQHSHMPSNRFSPSATAIPKLGGSGSGHGSHGAAVSSCSFASIGSNSSTVTGATGMMMSGASNTLVTALPSISLVVPSLSPRSNSAGAGSGGGGGGGGGGGPMPAISPEPPSNMSSTSTLSGITYSTVILPDPPSDASTLSACEGTVVGRFRKTSVPNVAVASDVHYCPVTQYVFFPMDHLWISLIMSTDLSDDF